MERGVTQPSIPWFSALFGRFGRPVLERLRLSEQVCCVLLRGSSTEDGDVNMSLNVCQVGGQYAGAGTVVETHLYKEFTLEESLLNIFRVAFLLFV